MFFSKLIKDRKNKGNNVRKNVKFNYLNKSNNEVNNFKVGFSFKKIKTIKIVNSLIKQKVSMLLFYTDVSNILRQLEFGLQPIKYIKLSPSEEYTVWTYLEKWDYLEFELDNSTRYYFWNWISEQNVDINQIAVIALSLKKLFNETKINWTFDSLTRRVQIYENVSPCCIKWILVKNSKYVNRIKNYVKNNNLEINIFQGEKGNITDIMESDR